MSEKEGNRAHRKELTKNIMAPPKNAPNWLKLI